MTADPEFDPTGFVRVRAVVLRDERTNSTIDQVWLTRDKRKCSGFICRFAFRVVQQRLSSPAGDAAIVRFNGRRVFGAIFNRGTSGLVVRASVAGSPFDVFPLDPGQATGDGFTTKTFLTRLPPHGEGVKILNLTGEALT